MAILKVDVVEHGVANRGQMGEGLLQGNFVVTVAATAQPLSPRIARRRSTHGRDHRSSANARPG